MMNNKNKPHSYERGAANCHNLQNQIKNCALKPRNQRVALKPKSLALQFQKIKKISILKQRGFLGIGGTVFVLWRHGGAIYNCNDQTGSGILLYSTERIFKNLCMAMGRDVSVSPDELSHFDDYRNRVSHRLSVGEGRAEESEIQTLYQKLFYRNCLLTAAVIFSIMAGLIIIDLNLLNSGKTDSSDNQEDILLNRATQYYSANYQQVVDTVQYLGTTGSMLIAHENSIVNLSETLTEQLYSHHSFQFICLLGTHTANNTLELSNISQGQCHQTYMSSVNVLVYISQILENEHVEDFVFCRTEGNKTLAAVAGEALICGVMGHEIQKNLKWMSKSVSVASAILADNYRTLFEQPDRQPFSQKYSLIRCRYNCDLGEHLVVRTFGSNVLIMVKVKFHPLSLHGENEECPDCLNSELFSIQLVAPYFEQIASSTRDIEGHQVADIIDPSNANYSPIFSFSIYRNSFATESRPVRILLTVLPILSPLILIAYAFCVDGPRLIDYLRKTFSRLALLNQLYKNSIIEIFTFNKITSSNVLQPGPLSRMFSSLSELTHRSIAPIHQEEEPLIERESFKFSHKVKSIGDKYRAEVSKVMHDKNKSILNNRFNIQSYVNELCEEENKKMKNYYVRTQQLHIEKNFFLFAYMAVLKTPERFLSFIKEDQTPFPDELTEYFVNLNRLMHETDRVRERIEELEKINISGWNSSKSKSNVVEEEAEQVKKSKGMFEFMLLKRKQSEAIDREKEEQEKMWQEKVMQENRDEIEIRIRVHLIPKYLAMLRDLDIQNHYAQELELEREIWSLTEIIENTRYLLTRHNKNIRLFSK